MNRSNILEKADELINGQRAKDYGDAYHNHTRILEGWNIIVREAMCNTGYLTTAHVALMMDWVKTARLLQTPDHMDSWIDKCGYSALGAEFAQKDARPVDEMIAALREPSNDK